LSDTGKLFPNTQMLLYSFSHAAIWFNQGHQFRLETYLDVANLRCRRIADSGPHW